MLNKEGRPYIANVGIGLLVVIVVLLIYVFFVPFDFVFKDDGEVVYTQRGVSAWMDFEKESKEIEGGEAVYGKDAPKYYYGETKDKTVFSDSGFEFRWKMITIALKNLVTLNWDREDFELELNARPR